MGGEAARRFGRNLFMARRRAGYSQEELAALCSLHRTEIGLVENGRRLPRVDTLVKLVSTLGIRADDLLRGIEWMPPVPTRPGGFCVALPV
jgi:transcriptional regulator with XRE-family HTH domain